jgi:ribonuclease III
MGCKFLIYDIFSKIRLQTVKQKEPYLLFHSILGYFPRNIEVYELALRHKSSSTRSENGVLLNNERLEFLGDAVLNVLVSDILFNQYENASEGFLSKTRARIVQRESLNKIALDLGLNCLIVSAPTMESPHLSIYGNALEALIGAIYVDQGYRRCRQFLEKKIFDQFIDIESIAASDINYKSRLLEWSQQQKKAVSFQTEEIDASAENNIRFRAIVLLDDIQMAEGFGFSKKESQQNASKKAIEVLKNLSNSEKESQKDNQSPISPEN